MVQAEGLHLGGIGIEAREAQEMDLTILRVREAEREKKSHIVP